MKIKFICIQNFRKLKLTKIELSHATTVFVGANNSGKTTAMDALGKFLANRQFDFNDFTITNRKYIDLIGEEWTKKGTAMPEDLEEWEEILPKMDVWLDVRSNEVHYVADIIPTLEWKCGLLGVRLIYQPLDPFKLFTDFRTAFDAARTTEESDNTGTNSSIKLFPNSLSDFLNKNIAKYFSIKSYILDENRINEHIPQTTPYDLECFTSNPIQHLIQIDMINAQRGFSDPDSFNGNSSAGNQLSSQIRNYYDKHLDPEKTPSPEDLDILRATEESCKIFDENLKSKFAPSIKELEQLGYPGLSDPKISIESRVNTLETINHESAVQYSMSKNDVSLKLPEKYNGLGYQNLISMVFDLISFRDSWMHVGKAHTSIEPKEAYIKPLHLVLVEEPEAHLHMQVQQVFIRKAYSVLRNHELLQDNHIFSSQLVISTHSSHIAREENFANLRYFKRIPEDDICGVSTAEVVNLSDVFDKENDTNKFVSRYLQSTHCDLFFADASIFIEGSAENMLLPHFIRNHYPELHQRYITILTINGRHSHKFDPLIKKLCLPTLIITDLDSVSKDGHHKSQKPEFNKDLISGNYAITKWLIQKENLDELISLDSSKKEFSRKDPFEYSIRVAYQNLVPVKFDEEHPSCNALSSTFEDCLIYTNYDLFKTLDTSDSSSFFKKIQNILKNSKSFEEMHNNIYDSLFKGSSKNKVEFALDILYAVDPKKLTIPLYIREGLEWLEEYLKPVEACR